MGQSSSQLEQPTQLSEDELEDTLVTLDRPSTAGTTGSEALARDLERSIMDSSQDVERRPRKKKRKKKRPSTDNEPFIPDSQPSDTAPQAPTAMATTATDEPTSESSPDNAWKSAETPLEIARRDLQKWLKRKQMQEAVLENRARWVQMPNKKWGIKFYKPGEAPEKELNEAEATHLRLIKMEMEKCRRALAASAPEGEKEEQVGGGGEVEVESNKRKKKDQSGVKIEDVPTTAEEASVAEEHTEEPRAGKPKKRKRKTNDEVPEPQPAEAVDSTEPQKKRKKKQQKRQEEPEDSFVEQRPQRESARKAEVAQKELQANTDNVTAWLASQDPPEVLAKPDAVEGNGATQANRRKRVSQFQKDDEEAYHPEAKTTESSVPTTKSGPFTAEEKAICDTVFGQVCDIVQRRLNMTDAELKTMIQQWRTAGLFKTELQEALPNRSKDQIRKFAQRRYHNHECGPWTADQDDALRDAHAKWPGQWSKICDLVDRTADDCKDRWVKHLQFGDKKASGPWSQKEETKLLEAVDECLEIIKKEYHEDKDILQDRKRLESMISWKTVSDKVDGGRSAKRCREKYEKLKAREHKGGVFAPTAEESTATSASDAAKRASKDEQAKKVLKGFEIGDYYDVFVEIHSAFDDHSEQFDNEKNVLWSIVTQKNPASRFNSTWLGAALRRVAVETALTEWPVESKKIRRKIEQAQTISAKALQLAKLVEQECGDATDGLPRTFKPELIGKTAAELAVMKQEKKKAQKPKKKDLSKDRVSESDDDEDDDAVQQTLPTTRSRGAVKKGPADVDDDDEEEQEVPETSEDELASPARNIRREPSQAHENDDEDEDSSSYDDQAEDTGDDTPQQASKRQFKKPNIPKSRRQHVSRTYDDVPVSSLNSRVGMDSVEGTPSLSPEAFLQRCKTIGKQQHEEYMGRTGGGSRRK